MTCRTEEGQPSSPIFYIVPPEAKALFGENASNVKEITLSLPIINQLFDIPLGCEIQPLAPEEMDPVDRNTFLVRCYQAIVSYEITKKTYGDYSCQWIANSLTNRDRILTAPTVDRLDVKQGKDFALIVGGGPSVKPELIPANADVFCCWNAVGRLGKVVPDYVGHVDPSSRAGYPTQFGNNTKLIATPQVDPAFLDISGELYAYLDPCNPCNTWFANYFKMGCHQHIVGTVAHMLTNAAIYAGYKTIALMGVDHAWVSGDYDSAKGCEITEVVNRHGIMIKTYSVFQTCSYAFFETMNYFPDVKIYQTSETALDIQGVDYRPIEAF